METQTPPAEPVNNGDLGTPNPQPQNQPPAAPPPAPNEPAKSFADLLDDKGNFKQGWTQALPEHLKPFEGTLQKYPNPWEVFSGLGNAQKFISSRQQLKPLDANATEEQRAAYVAELRKITGAPEKPEDYGLQAPENLPEGTEWNAEFAGNVAQIAAKHAIPKAALQELADAHNQHISKMIATGDELSKQEQQRALDELTKEWGADAANNFDRAKRGIVALGGDPKKDSYTIQDIMRMALRADQMVRPDSELIGQNSPTASVDERMRTLQADPAYQNPKTTADFKRQAEIANELQRLHAYKKQFG